MLQSLNNILGYRCPRLFKMDTQNPRENGKKEKKKKTVRIQRVSDYIDAKLHRSEISFLYAIIRGRAKFCNIEIEWISANSQKCVILNFHIFFLFHFVQIFSHIHSYIFGIFHHPSFRYREFSRFHVSFNISEKWYFFNVRDPTFFSRENLEHYNFLRFYNLRLFTIYTKKVSWSKI